MSLPVDDLPPGRVAQAVDVGQLNPDGSRPGPTCRSARAVEADRGAVAQGPGAGEVEQAQRAGRLPHLQEGHIAARVDDSGVGEDLCRAGEQVAGGVQDSAVGVLACRKRVRIPAASRVWPPGPHLAPRQGEAACREDDTDELGAVHRQDVLRTGLER